MSDTKKKDNPERKEDARLETYRTAINDARHIYSTYKNSHPDDAWECIRRIIFSDKLK